MGEHIGIELLGLHLFESIFITEKSKPHQCLNLNHGHANSLFYHYYAWLD